MMRSLASRGKTVLVSTHILSEVQQIADTVTIISRGRLLAEGDVSDILGADGRVAARVGVSDHLRATEVLTASGFTVERLPNRILRVSLVSRKLDLAVITRLLADQGLYVSELTPIQPDLESVFLALGLRASEEGSGYPARSAASGASNQTPDRAPLSWTSEAADTFFVCEQARKAAATPRDPPRAERAIKPRIARRCPGRARQQTLLRLRASEEGSGYPARSAASGASNQTPDRAPLSWTSEAADTFFVCEQARKAAATPRDPPRAERAIKPRIARRCPGRARQQTRSSVCEQARKAAATPRDPPRAERAIKPRIARRCPGRARQQTRSSSASKRGRQRLPRAIRRERSEQSNTVG